MTAKTPATNTPAKPNMTHYNQAVKAGIKASSAAGSAAWIIGDLARKVATEYGENTIQRFADDIGMAVGTVRNYRTVAGAYATGKRSAVNTFTVHEKFASLANRDELLVKGPDGSGRAWKASEAREYVKSLATGDGTGGDDDDNGGGDTAPTPELSEIEKARLRVQELQGQLMAAMAHLAKLEAEEPAAPQATAPKATAPKATAPKATAPKATAPKATAPKATAPKATAPKAAPAKASASRISDTVSAESVRARYAGKSSVPQAGSPRRSRTRTAA